MFDLSQTKETGIRQTPLVGWFDSLKMGLSMMRRSLQLGKVRFEPFNTKYGNIDTCCYPDGRHWRQVKEAFY